MIDIFDFLKKADKEAECKDEFDKKFGAPKTETFATKDLLGYLNKIISDFGSDDFSLSDSEKSCKIAKFIATDSFENAVKLLYKKQRKDVLTGIRKAIVDLSSEGKSGKHTDIDIDDEKIALQYSAITENIMIIGFKADTIKWISDYNK